MIPRRAVPVLAALAIALSWAGIAAPAPPVASLADPADVAGGSLTPLPDGDGWLLSETSSGTVPNRGSSFLFRFGPGSEALAAINAALAAPVGTFADFQLGGFMDRTASAGAKFVSAEISAAYEGRDRPAASPFPRPIILKGNAFYESGTMFALEAASPHTRFRVYGTGGASRIDAFTIRLSLRPDSGGSPESVELRSISVTHLPDSPSLGLSNIILCPQGLPPIIVLNTWRAHRIEVRPGLDPAPGETVAGVWCPQLDLLSDAEAEKIASVAENGASLWLGIGPAGLRGDPPAALRTWLPANLWSFKSGLDRGRGIADAASWSSPPRPLSLSHRYDLHLPGSPIESALAAYLPDEWLRDSARFPRTTVRAKNGTDAGLPLWLDADVGPSHVELFAFDPEDPWAMASSDYDRWAIAFASAPLVPLPPQPPANPKPETGNGKPEAQPISIAIEEDESSLSELDPAPQPREGIDGITSRRYVYHTGTSPKLRVRLRNRLRNIASRATPRDELWPENPSAHGLVDNAFTTASVRNTLPIHAIWTGRNGTNSQNISLRWDSPVHIRGVRLWGFGPHRHWERANPRSFSLSADDAPLHSETAATYTPFVAAPERAVWEWQGGARGVPPVLRKLSLSISFLAPSANLEPRRDWPSNCALAEWEVWGWDGPPDPSPSRTLSLRVVQTDLTTGAASTNVFLASEAIPFCSERAFDVPLPARDSFGPVRWIFQALENGRVVAEEPFDAFFVPPSAPALGPREPPDTAVAGLLCTPGWRAITPFGLGMNNWTRGWGGAHDQIWAWENDLLESGGRTRDDPARLFGGALRASHYTLPWKRLPNGDSAYRHSADPLLDRLATGDWHRQGKTSILVGGSDRWNGIPVGSCFTWDHFVRFDRWLRDQGRPGLRARSRAAISREIREELGDLWQRFLLADYATLHLDIQREAAERGLGYTFETHGSFPLAGGDLGADLARTHRGVGTDLFWDLRRQDLWGTLGLRVAVVASNPDLESGAYDEWGWVNSEQNRWWYGSNSSVGPARRQWYATYFLGRVDLSGAFRPYHMTGFSSQGNHGPRYTAADHAARCRVHQLVTHLRPEAPVGFGLVVSWRGQERRMGPRLGRSGFGLWPADGEAGVEEMCGAVFAALVKQGIPVAFVTSTHALRNWRGSNPLVLVDAPNWEDWEWEAALAAHANGASLVVVGDSHPRLANPHVLSSLSAAKPGDGLIWSRVSAARFTAHDTAVLSRMNASGVSVVTPGIAVTPFNAQGRLFLAVCNQGDEPLDAILDILTADTRAVSLDDGRALPCKQLSDHRLRLSVFLPPCDARVVMLCP